MNAYLYFRVSTGRQAEADRQSLPAQKEDAAAWCHDHHLTVVGTAEDHESGTHATRVGYQTMLERCRAGGVDVVVVREFSRFGRERLEAVQRAAELMQLGIEIHEFGKGDVIKDDDASFFAVAFKAFSADAQAKEIRRNSKRGQQRSASAGRFMGRSSYGYTKTPDGLKVERRQANVVRRIFSWYTEDNLSTYAIARRLNATGVKTLRDRSWDQATVLKVLKNRTYTGDTAWAGVPQSCPPVVTQAVWEAAQARRERKATLPAGQTQTSTFLLAGLVRCGVCGHAFIGHTSRPKPIYEYRSYVCSKAILGACTNRRRVKADWLEEYVVDHLTAILGEVGLTDAVGADIESLQAELAHIEQERATVVRNRDTAIRTILSGGEADIGNAIAGEMLAELDKARSTVEASLRAAEQQRNVARDMQSTAQTLRQFVEESQVSQAKIALQALVKCVTVPQDDECLPEIVV